MEKNVLKQKKPQNNLCFSEAVIVKLIVISIGYNWASVTD